MMLLMLQMRRKFWYKTIFTFEVESNEVLISLHREIVENWTTKSSRDILKCMEGVEIQ